MIDDLTYFLVKFGEIQHSVVSIVDYALICDLVCSWDQIMLSLIIADFDLRSWAKGCESLGCRFLRI